MVFSRVGNDYESNCCGGIHAASFGVCKAPPRKGDNKLADPLLSWILCLSHTQSSGVFE